MENQPSSQPEQQQPQVQPEPPKPKFEALEKVRQKDLELLTKNEVEMNEAKHRLTNISQLIPEALLEMIDAKRSFNEKDKRMQADLEKILRRHGVNKDTAERAYFDPEAGKIMVWWKGDNTETQPSPTEDEHNAEGSSNSAQNNNQENNNMSEQNQVGNDADEVNKQATRPETADGAGEGTGDESAESGAGEQSENSENTSSDQQ